MRKRDSRTDAEKRRKGHCLLRHKEPIRGERERELTDRTSDEMKQKERLHTNISLSPPHIKRRSLFLHFVSFSLSLSLSSVSDFCALINGVVSSCQQYFKFLLFLSLYYCRSVGRQAGRHDREREKKERCKEYKKQKTSRQQQESHKIWDISLPSCRYDVGAHYYAFVSQCFTSKTKVK